MNSAKIVAFLPGKKKIQISFGVGVDGNLLVNPATGAVDVQLECSDQNTPPIIVAQLLTSAVGAALSAIAIQLQGGTVNAAQKQHSPNSNG